MLNVSSGKWKTPHTCSGLDPYLSGGLPDMVCMQVPICNGGWVDDEVDTARTGAMGGY